MSNAFTRRQVLQGAGAAALAAGASAVLAGCSGLSLGGASAGKSGKNSVIKIGYVTPRTGSLAAFGATDTYVINAMTSYFKQHKVKLADGSEHAVQIIAKDTQSDSKRASDVASDLILNEGVQLVLVSSTPDTTNPVSDQCEANGVVCISTVAPWQSWYYGRGATGDKGYKWTYHFFWGLEDAESVYSTIWKATQPDAKNVALLLPNDSDGTAWADKSTGFPAFITKKGMRPDDPGEYPDGTTDFSAQIAQFKQKGDTILTTIPIPPDFTTFWKQAVQQGFKPTTVTCAKAILFPTSVQALGALGQNLSTEVWWAPAYPYSSSLTGQSAKQLADDFEKTTKQQWSQPLGFAEALFEVAAAALSTSKSLDADDIRTAVSKLKVDTVVGTVDWASGGPVPNVSKTPLVGGQWRSTDGGKSYDLVIVANPDTPNIPTGGTPEPISWT